MDCWHVFYIFQTYMCLCMGFTLTDLECDVLAQWKESLTYSSEISIEGDLNFCVRGTHRRVVRIELNSKNLVCDRWMGEINKQREAIAVDRQGTQQQRPESPTVTPPGMQVNARYINSTKGASSSTCPCTSCPPHFCFALNACFMLVHMHKFS